MEYLMCPPDLIRPLQAGFSIQDKPQVERLDMEVGEPRENLLAAVQGGEVSFNAIFTAAGKRELMVFFREACRYGTVWFYLPIDSGGGIAPHRVKFNGAPKWQPAGVRFRASIRIQYSEPAYNWE